MIWVVCCVQKWIYWIALVTQLVTILKVEIPVIPQVEGRLQITVQLWDTGPITTNLKSLGGRQQQIDFHHGLKILQVLRFRTNLLKSLPYTGTTYLFLMEESKLSYKFFFWQKLQTGNFCEILSFMANFSSNVNFFNLITVTVRHETEGTRIVA